MRFLGGIERGKIQIEVPGNGEGEGEILEFGDGAGAEGLGISPVVVTVKSDTFWMRVFVNNDLVGPPHPPQQTGVKNAFADSCGGRVSQRHTWPAKSTSMISSCSSGYVHQPPPHPIGKLTLRLDIHPQPYSPGQSYKFLLPRDASQPDNGAVQRDEQYPQLTEQCRGAL